MTISPLLFIGLICLAGGGSLLPAEAIWLTIPSSGERCVYEMIQANVVVVGDYLCIDQDNVGFGPTIDIHVTSPDGKELYKKTNETHGQFAFTTSETGTYFACLSSHHDQGVELELRKSEERVNEISANIIYLRVREAYMREVNDKTNKRVAQLSFMSLGLSITVSLFQVWHLKRFFLKKKLI
ncbi:hypothetical protein IGI04_011730 [Brassica rapa subsp. trilocularis]|uniref:GOLD domain-containing protein n=1 Tax=Brassica rapa subsp. trilocularis TaxID=1813537 RepID=A0ABQ7N661_BRACM|nr:hypothetical protein IGI04_011730 [Brassica rapa subsp. trilocularis]